MSGAGKSQVVGQPCTIWNRDGSYVDGIVVSVNSDPGSNSNDGPSLPDPTIIEVAIDSEGLGVE